MFVLVSLLILDCPVSRFLASADRKIWKKLPLPLKSRDIPAKSQIYHKRGISAVSQALYLCKKIERK
jgi:hypothetical protein